MQTTIKMKYLRKLITPNKSLIVNSLITSKYNELFISNKSPTNVLTKQKIELQQSKSVTKTSSVVYTIDNNIMKRETKQPNNCTRKKI